MLRPSQRQEFCVGVRRYPLFRSSGFSSHLQVLNNSVIFPSSGCLRGNSVTHGYNFQQVFEVVGGRVYELCTLCSQKDIGKTSNMVVMPMRGDHEFDVRRDVNPQRIKIV